MYYTILRARIGSVSHGTMRAEDLIPAFIDELDDIKDELATSGDASDYVKDAIKRIDDLCAAIEQRMYGNAWPEDDPDESVMEEYFGSEEASYDLEELFDVLNEFAPPYFHFGAHEGDGADYGWWFCEEALRNDMYDMSVIPLAGDEWPEDEIRERMDGDRPVSYVVNINERGNITLWAATEKESDRKEIWSIV